MKRQFLVLTFISITTFICCAAAPAQVTFTDVTETAGLGGFPAAFATWGDYDNNGDADLVLLREVLPGIRLYHERKVTRGKNQTV
jgi:hypothetical protein